MPKSAQINHSNEHHWHRTWSLALLSLCVIVLSFSVYLVYSEKNNSPVMATLSQVGLEYRSEKQSIKAGGVITLEVYFTGENASDVIISDIRPTYDKTTLSLVKAEKGKYFTSPITKFDNEKSFYVLASDPSAPQPKDKNLPVMSFQFKALKSGKVEVGFSPESLVFIEGEKDGKVNGQTVSIEVTK